MKAVEEQATVGAAFSFGVTLVAFAASQKIWLSLPLLIGVRYRKLGILPEVAEGLRAAQDVSTPAA